MIVRRIRSYSAELISPWSRASCNSAKRVARSLGISRLPTLTPPSRAAACRVRVENQALACQYVERRLHPRIDHALARTDQQN